MKDMLHTENTAIRAIERYSDTLIRIAYTYLKNRSDSEDIVQEVFLKLVEKAPIFTDEEHEKAWLIRVAINLSKNHLKSAWFKRTIPFDDKEYSFTPKENEVMSTVLELPVKYRSLIFLFYFEKYKITEIADILGKKESTVGSQLYRARKLLKAKLKEDFDDENR